MIYIFFCCCLLNFFVVPVLLTAHAERFSVSCMRDFLDCCLQGYIVFMVLEKWYYISGFEVFVLRADLIFFW